MHDFFRQRGCNLPGDPFPATAELENFISGDLQALFQRFRDTEPRLYVECIQEIFATRPMSHKDCTIKILQNRPPLIATLNFDIAIEAAAQVCKIPFSSRYFPGIRHLSQSQPDAPVIMHLHGMFHEGLFESPDDIILHTSSYRKYYEEGNREILSVFADIFLRWDVIFLGTALSEPEMAFFFRVLHAHQAKGNYEKKRIALLETLSPSVPSDLESGQAFLREEESKDFTDREVTGIERVRYFRKDDDFRGLDEILTTAFGQKIAVPEPERIW